MRHTPATARGIKTGRDIKRLDQGKQPQEEKHGRQVQSTCVAGDLPGEAEFSDLC